MTTLTPTPTDTDGQLDVAVRHATAFPAWQDLQASLDGGYVPTLRDDYGDLEFRDAIGVIRRHMATTSRRYFDGTRLVG